MITHIKTIVVAALAITLVGCASYDRRDRSYDPCIRCGESLLDQIPNWDPELTARARAGQ